MNPREEAEASFKYNPAWVRARLRGMIPPHLSVYIGYDRNLHEFVFSMSIPDLRDIRNQPLTEQAKLSEEYIEQYIENDEEIAQVLGSLLDLIAKALLKKVTS